MYWNEGITFRIIQKSRPFFPGSSHKIKFHIFQNMSNHPIHGLRAFKYYNTFEVYERTQDKDKRPRIQMKNVLFFVKRLLISFMKRSHKKYWFNGMWEN